MVKKKSVKKTKNVSRAKTKKKVVSIPRKKIVKKVSPVKKKTIKTKSVKVTKNKINLVLRNILLFAIMFLISFVLYLFLSDLLLRNFFFLSAVICASFTGAFLIILLIFLIMRGIKKKR